MQVSVTIRPSDVPADVRAKAFHVAKERYSNYPPARVRYVNSAMRCWIETRLWEVLDAGK